MSKHGPARTVRLGYALGSGDVVEIPIRHMAVCGQTQEAGKTTALEALITRAGIRALTFVTKRGEGAFSNARRIEPYFREQADWQFVASILEASRGEKLKFERAWIIRASKGARTLADVQRNVRAAMDKARGMSADVYLTLDAYLDVVVPEIARVRWAPRVELAAGVNVMDLSGIPSEMQHLVIKSAIEWVLERESDTVIVVPEAWKFLPQGRGTPVKRAAAAFIRQGAALQNYLWLDSQDLGGIEKEILRSVPVWILGVQRETNEIKRTLANIPDSVAKPKPAAIATLQLGQFIACWGTHAIATYAQPAWMVSTIAIDVATGRMDVRNAAAIAGGVNVRTAFEQVFGSGKEEQVTKQEAARLERENAQLKADNEALHNELDALTNRLRTLEEGHHDGIPKGDRTAHRGGDSGRGTSSRAGARAAEAHPTAPGDRGGGPRVGPAGVESAASNGVVDEATYQAIKARLITEIPSVLRVLVERPELNIEVDRQTVTIDASTTKGRVARLLALGFFDDSKRFSESLRELERTGTRVNNKSLSVAFGELVVAGFLTKESVDRYRAVSDMKVNVVER